MAGMNAGRNAVFVDVRKSVPSPSLTILRSSAARKVCFTSASRPSSEVQNAAEEERDGTPIVSDEAKETASAMPEKAKDSMRQDGEKASSAKEKAKENAELGKQKVEENVESAKEKTSSAAEAAKEKAKENVERAKEKTTTLIQPPHSLVGGITILSYPDLTKCAFVFSECRGLSQSAMACSFQASYYRNVTLSRYLKKGMRYK